MSQIDIEQMKKLISPMRRTYLAVLDRCSYTGECISISSSGLACDIWLHRSRADEPRPLVIELHGGGFAFGDARKGDALRAWVRDSFDVNVAGIDYRLAPEHTYPAALEDVVSSIGYFAEHAAELKVDVNRIYFMGYSAGANLALSAAFALQNMRKASETTPYPAGIIIHYPFLDAFTEPRKPNRDTDIAYEFMLAFNAWYAAGEDPRISTISPLFASDEELACLPPIYAFPVEGDSLESSCHVFCARLRNVGANVLEQTVPGQYHGYIEDAANLRCYLESSLPETIASRPHDFVDAARTWMLESLTDALRCTLRTEPFPHEDADRLAELFNRGKDEER